MSEINHTPGPWMVVTQLRDTDDIVCDMANACWVIPANGQALSDWNTDARLIAAAPDLLTDLREAAATLRRYESLHELAARFEATIAKATA